MIIRLPFGQGAIAVDLRGFRIRPLQPEGPRGRSDPAQIVLHAVARPLSGPSLEVRARAAGNAVVIVPDGTRSARIPEILPALLRALTDWGIAPHRQTIVVACGTHPPAPREELEGIVGSLEPQVTVIQHDARDASALVTAGTVQGGGLIRLHRAVMEADLLVTIGGVRHHYFAGFGGGPKMVFPGVAGYEEIQANHARVFDLSGSEPIRRPQCEPGRLEANPVAQEIGEAADLRPPDVSVCLVPGIGGGVAEAVAGPWREAFDAAVARVREIFEVSGDQFDLVVASGAGAPSDETLIQAHKGLDAACRFSRPGAEVLFLASMAGGAGSGAMTPFLEDPRPESILNRLAGGWVQYGHTTFRLVEKTARHRVSLVTEGDWAGLEGLGFERVATADEVVDRWREEFSGATVGVMTGPAVYPRK